MKNTLAMIPGELTADYRVRLALEQEHAEQVHRLAMSELTATENPPEARIRAWERTHGLTLPKSSDHPVLNSIAAATRLTRDQVHAEQRRRVTPVMAVAPG